MSPVIYTPPIPHRCELPYVTRTQPQIHLVPAHPEGTLWKCDDCGTIWRVEGRGLSDHARRAGLTALSTEWVRIVTGDEGGEIPDDMLEAAARAMAGLERGESWPSNEELGGSLTGTRDDEFRHGMREQARFVLTAALNLMEDES